MSNRGGNDNALARLIALFPGTDISVLSMALENYSDPDEAADFVRKTIKSHSDNEDDDSPGFKKPRPQGSARRREKKLSEDSQRQADEDEEFARRLIGGASDRSGDEQDRSRLDGGELSTAYKSDLNRVGNEINLTNEDDHRGLSGRTQNRMPQASSPSSDRGGLKPSPHNAALSLSPSPAHTRADSDEEDDDNGLNSMSDAGGDRSTQQQIQELYSYISTYQPETVELFPELKCFVPDYIPAIGDIDPMIKVPAPTVAKSSAVKGPAQNTGPDTSNLGLKVLDEPATRQSDPAVLDLQLRAASKETNSTLNQQVRSIQLTFSHAPGADVGQKAMAQWVQNVHDLHTHKPPDRVEYSRRMPDIEKLMEEWPQEIDDALSNKTITLPSCDIALPLPDYAKIICTVLDIPVGSQSAMGATTTHPSAAAAAKAKAGSKKDDLSKSHATIESLHVLFTLFSEFKNSQHFGRGMQQAVG